MGEPALDEGRCGELEWAACASAYPGQRRSGDGFLVEATERGTFVAVVDALGHGDEAAEVAGLALASLHETAGQPLADCLAACHAALRGSRGAAVTLAMVEPARRQVTWAGVGNVEAALVRRGRGGGPAAKRSVTLRGGVVGGRLPPFRPSTEAIAGGHTLIGATDGLGANFLDSLDLTLAPADLARCLHRTHAKDTDDALVFVALYLDPRTEVRSRMAPYLPVTASPLRSVQERNTSHDPEVGRPAQE